MRAFHLEFDDASIAQVISEAERCYPNEACGVILGLPDAEELQRVEPLRNMQDKFHKFDPERFKRTARDAFRLDDMQRMRLLDEAEKDGLVERVLFHSHCDAAAYFSAEDRAMAVQDGIELMPGVVYLVASVLDGRCADLAAYLYEEGQFKERRLPLEGAPPVTRDPSPRVQARHTALTRGLLDPDEADAWAEGAQVYKTEDERLWIAASLVIRGSYSPLTCLPAGLHEPTAGFDVLRLVGGDGYEAFVKNDRLYGCAERLPATVDPLDHRAEILRQEASRIVAFVGEPPEAQSGVLQWRVGLDAQADLRPHSLEKKWVQRIAVNHGATLLAMDGVEEL